MRSRKGVGQAQVCGPLPFSAPPIVPQRRRGRLLLSPCLRVCLSQSLFREPGCRPRGGAAWDAAPSPGCSLQGASIQRLGWGYEP